MEGMSDYAGRLATALSSTSEPTRTTRTATVSTVDNEGVVWVRLAGAKDDTPVSESFASVNPGDVVTVAIENGRASIVGSTSNPSAQVDYADAINAEATAASSAAQTAKSAAFSAQADASAASSAAASAQASASAAQADATQALTDAATAKTAADAAQADATAAGTAAQTAKSAADAAQADADTANAAASAAQADATQALSDAAAASSAASSAQTSATQAASAAASAQADATQALSDAAAASSAASSAQTSAGQAASAAATAGAAAAVAQAAADAVDGRVTNMQEWFYHDTNGSHVLGATSGYRNDIDSTGMSIVDTATETSVAQFGVDGSRVGAEEAAHSVIENNAFRMYDKDGNIFAEIDDMRDENGSASVTETLDVEDYLDGSAIYPSFPIHAISSLKINGQSTGGYQILDAGMMIYFYRTTFPDGSVADVAYTTISADAKSYTFGFRGVGRVSALSFAEGKSVVASAPYAHAEGIGAVASNNAAHAEGKNTVASGIQSHAEGNATVASGARSHAEGNNTDASGGTSHAEGFNTDASGVMSHAEGNATVASGAYSHAEGWSTDASGSASHAGGFNTVAGYDYQTVIGKYNNNKQNNIFEIGNGVSYLRRNAFEVDVYGKAVVGNDLDVADSVTVGGSLGVDGDVTVGGDITIGGKSVFEMIYPVGAIYMSVNATDPATLFGGTWQRIEDTFLLAAGTSHAAGTTGGEETHTLTVDEVPRHNHGLPNSVVGYLASSNKRMTTSGSSTAIDLNTNIGLSAQYTGGDEAHNNMPPYLAVYVWKRTA